MPDKKKTKEQLIDELEQLRQQVAELKSRSANGSVSGVSNYKRAAESWRESLEIISQSPVVVFLWQNAEGWPVEWVSENVEHLFGYTADDFRSGRISYAEIIHPEDLDDVVRDVTPDAKGNAIADFVHRSYRIITKDGQPRWVDERTNVRRNADGEITHYQGIVLDITERKHVEEALDESENRYRTLFEQSADAMLIIEGDEFIDCNPATVKMLGYSNKQELLDTHPSQLSPPTQPDGKSSFEKANEMMSIAFSQGSHRFEWDHMRQNGEVFPVEVLLTAVPFGKGTFLHTVWRDITERKRLEELESRAARLEMAGTIAGQVAHDFNNLLGPIIGYPDLIRDELPHDHKALPYLDDIERAAKNIAFINQDLLTMGRRGHYQQEVLDLNRIALHVAKEIESRSETVVVKMDLCPSLMKIKGGDAQIHRLLTNLLINAQDALQDIGEITIKTENYYADDTSVAFGRVPLGEYVKVSVSDNGCGIPADIVQHIFDPFFTTKTTDKKRGSGLGLSVVDAVMKDHGGFLDLQSTVGQGTSFYLYFRTTKEDMGVVASKHFGDVTETVLIVDDDAIQREVTFRLLNKIGYRVEAVPSGEKAIELLRETPHDLVILDMVMPGGIDGTETYRQILEFCPDQKAILLSGYSESKRVLKAQKLGAGMFVKKPVEINVLAAAVRTELDRVVETTG